MRLEITRRADLATRAMLILAAAEERTKAAALAAQLDASAGFVAQAMTPLVASGWVRSDPGPSGGYSLVADLDEVSVLEVIEAVEGPTDTARCVLEDRTCARGGHCALHVPWSRARTELLGELADTPLASLAPSRRR
jgi:Rrf2 family iron-sulfur cluster assembly transcriptional regulator